eukprot:52912-Chlamydomonas_euryale.AAC.4
MLPPAARPLRIARFALHHTEISDSLPCNSAPARAPAPASAPASASAPALTLPPPLSLPLCCHQGLCSWAPRSSCLLGNLQSPDQIIARGQGGFLPA